MIWRTIVRRTVVRLSPQLLVLLLGFLLWSVRPSPELWTLAAAYGAAWLVVNLILRRSRGLEIPWTAMQAVVLGAVLAAVPVGALCRQLHDMAIEEGLRGLGQRLADRVRLEALPAIAPPVVFSDHPQSFYIHAPGAEEVRLRWRDGRELASRSLTAGLFRVLYDPRRDGPPPGESASVRVHLIVDGRDVERELAVVRPEAHPRWFASDPERGRACAVSEETDEVFVVSRRGLERRIPVDDGPTDCAFVDGGGRLAVSHRYGPYLRLIDPATGEPVSEVLLGPFQARLAASPGGSLLAVAMAGLDPGLRFVDLVSGEAGELLPLGFVPDWIAFGPDQRQLIVSSAVERSLFKLVRRGGWQVAESLYLGRPAVTLGRAPGGGRLYVATTDYRPDGEDHRGNHFIQDQILTVDVARFRVVEQYLTQRRSARQVHAGSVDRGVSPMGIAARGDGTLLVAFAGSDEVWELDADLTRPPKMFWGLDLDLIAPHGVADLGQGYWAASSPAGGSMAVYTRSGEMVTYVGVTPTDSELAAAPEGSLARQALVHRSGEHAFYEATRAGISCQSCHAHGDTDYSPHDIGQTPMLYTLTTQGVARTAPYLRDGSFPRIRDLDSHLARTLLRGYRRYLPHRGELLEAWVEALPRHVNPRLLAPRDLERERAGAAAFVKAECVMCHAFPALTNLSQHPVRALFPGYGAGLSPTVRLDTPSLLGVHAKTHFLQDGRAETLAQVLDEHNRANRHGDTAVLSADERQALVRFLESL